MEQHNFHIDSDITIARLPDGSFYDSQEIFELQKEAIFKSAWHWIGVHNAVREAESAFPFELMEGFLAVPLVLTKGSDGLIRLLSNVCTHRGNILSQKPGPCKVLRCQYHGRRFELDGTLSHAPGFDECENFPDASDNLPSVPMAEWGPFLFANLSPRHSFGLWTSDLKNYLHWLPIHQFRLDSTRTKEYVFDANWALYVENYLEGFHIPFVHGGLNATIDISQYETELLEYGVLQKAIAKEDELAFELPPESPDFGKRIAAYYFWLFPNTMLNFYPWGLSLNIVRPLGTGKTKVSFVTYVQHGHLLDRGAGANLDTVEKEDEDVVLNVQRGIRSSLHKGGRYSPEFEKGVHHFHRLMMGALEKA